MDWEFGSGTYHTGKKAGKPLIRKRIGTGKIAVLTTRFPMDEEEDRKIIGFFSIRRIEGKADEEKYVVADDELRVRLRVDEARKLRFYEHYKMEGAPFWGAGLIRYLTEAQVIHILENVRDIAKGKRAETANRIYNGVRLPKSALHDSH